MALFGRKNTNNEVPEDLQQYYNTGGTGIFKWMLRIVAGVIVLALLVWGGIWAAHKISNGDQTDKPQTAQNNNSDDAQKKAQQQAKAQADAKKSADEARKKAEAAAQAQQQQAQQQSQSQQPSQVATNGDSGSQPAQPQSTGNGSGSSSSATTNNSLPNTGPGETAVVLFAGATVLGAGVHMMLTRKRQLR